MKEEVVWLRDGDVVMTKLHAGGEFESHAYADELQDALLAWQRRYNGERPHQALGWKTSAEYRAEKPERPVEEAA